MLSTECNQPTLPDLSIGLVDRGLPPGALPSLLRTGLFSMLAAASRVSDWSPLHPG